MNNILCFDTSNNSCSVAIICDEKIVALEQELCPGMQAERIMVMIESSLNATKMVYNEFSHLAVTTGPGSFTGIKIGLAVAKAITHTTHIKPIAVTNFEVINYRRKRQIKGCDNSIIILNAYRNQQYIQVSIQDNNYIQLIDNEALVTLIESYTKRFPITCAGNGVLCIYDYIKDLHNLIVLPNTTLIKAYDIAKLALYKLSLNQPLTPFLEPLYIRPPDVNLGIEKVPLNKGINNSKFMKENN